VIVGGIVPEIAFELRSKYANDCKRLNVKLGSVPLRLHSLQLIPVI
jgi:hypothetical protein